MRQLASLLDVLDRRILVSGLCLSDDGWALCHVDYLFIWYICNESGYLGILTVCLYCYLVLSTRLSISPLYAHKMSQISVQPEPRSYNGIFVDRQLQPRLCDADINGSFRGEQQNTYTIFYYDGLHGHLSVTFTSEDRNIER